MISGVARRTALTKTAPARAPCSANWPLAILLFVAAFLALAWPWLSGVVVIPWDAKAHSYAQLQFLARSLHSGDSPFWTPNVFAGSPQIADPQSLIFAPQFLALAALSPDPSFRAADGAVFLMLFVAGVAMLMIFRDRGWRAEGALVASIALAFGGSAAWRLQHIGEVSSLCWFVIALCLLMRGLSRGSALWGLAAGVAAGFMVAGRDQIAYLSTLFLVLYVVWHAVETGVRRVLLPLAAGLFGGLVAAALPVALSVALAAQSNRPAIDFTGAARGSLHPAFLLTAWIANLFGTAGPEALYWGPAASSFWGRSDLVLARNMGEIYFGALPLVALVAIGLFGGAVFRREARVFTVGAVLLLLYALGGYTPFFRLVFRFPGIDLFRRPADATFPLCALLALLAGYSINILLAEPAGLRNRARLACAAAIGPIAGSGLALSAGRLDQAGYALATGAFFLGLTFVLLGPAEPLLRARPALGLALMAGLLTLDLAVCNAPNESTGLPPQTYDVLRPDTQNATIRTLKSLVASSAGQDGRDRVEIAAIDFQWPNAGLVHDLDNDLGYNPIRLRLFETATHAEDQVAVPEQRVFSPLFPSYHSRMADLLGLRYLALGVPAEEIDRKLKPGDLVFLGRTPDAYLYENPRALPRVLFAGSARTADFGRLLQTGEWPDFDPRRTVLLDPAPSPPAEEPARPARSGTARLLSYRNTRVVIEAEAPAGGGWVVLNDIWHPWWFAEVDGHEAPIMRANVIFRAVRVPAGRHRIVFEFEPLRGLLRQIRAEF